MRRALRITAWSLAGVLLLAVILIAAILVVGNTSAGRRLIERQTARFTSGRVRIYGLGGTFPGAIDISRLEMHDAQGVWMTAERVSVRWSPLALIRWDLHIERVGIARVDVARKPVSAPASPASSRSSSGSSLPSIDIDQIAIGTLDLEPAAAGLEARLNVQGDAHYKSLEALRANLSAHRTNGRGTYVVALHLTPSRMNGSLNLDEPAGGPLEHLANLPGLGALSVSADFEGPRTAVSLRLAARAGELRADASGTVDLVHRAADLAYRVNSSAMMPRPGLSWMRIAMQGRWRGPLTAPHADAALDLAGVVLPDGAQLAKLAATLDANGRLLTVHATADGIMLPSSEPQLLAGSPLKADATIRLDAPGRPLNIKISHRLLDLSADALTAGPRSATFNLRLPDVAELASLLKENLHGSLELTGSVAERGETTGLDVSGTGNLGGASLPAQLLGANLRLHLAAAATAAEIQIQTLEVNGRALSLSASGTADRATQAPSAPAAKSAASSVIRAIHVRWQIALADLAVLSPSMKGSLDTRGTADGPLRSIAANVQVRSTLSVSGSPPGTVEATLQARGLPSAPSGSVRATGTLAGAPLRLDASLQQVQSGTYHVVVRRTEWKSMTADGDLTAGKNLAAARGNMHLSIGSLADLKEFVGTSLAGSINATVALVPGAKHGGANIELDARNVAANGFEGNAKLSATGPLDALRVDLTAQSANIGGEPASLSSAALLDEPAQQISLERFEAHYHGQTARLLSPSRVTFGKELAVRNLRIGAQQAIIAVNGELSPALNVRASIRNVRAALVNAFVPNMLADGTFNAEARLRGSRSAPVGSASFEIEGLKLATVETAGLPAASARGSAQFRGDTASVSAELHAGAESQVTLSGLAPMNSTGTVALKLSGHINAALMNVLLEARGERASGTISLDARVEGTAKEPQIDGTVLLANGDLRDYAEGVHLEHINARLVGGHGVLKIASMSARAGPGQLSAQGTIGVLEPEMPISIELEAHRIQPITNDILTANLDANMRIAGTLRQHLDVTGTVHVNRAAITIPNGFPPEVAVLDVVTPGQTAKPAATTSKLVIGLDLTLDAPESIFVQGRGLDAQLGGKLVVTGTSDNPQVSGGFRMIRGAFSLAGTELMFTSGKVSFNGEGLKGKIDPTLDFIAQASVTYNQPTTVTLHVTGFADAPKLELSSTPPLPQDDLLGLLLFGKPASQLTALQLAEVGGGLASLGGIGGGGGGGTLSKLNPLTWLKRVFGLNTLSVGGGQAAGSSPAGSTQSTGASVTAGKYISNKVYVAATQTTTGSSQVQVDVDLTQRLKLQTRLGNGTATAQGTTPQNDPGSSIGLSYQFQY